MDKKELLKQVDDIYLILSSLSVSGDAVDAVAALRSKLRNLRSGIAKLPEAEKENLNPGPGPRGPSRPEDIKAPGPLIIRRADEGRVADNG